MFSELSTREKASLAFAIFAMLVLILYEHTSLIPMNEAAAVALCVIAYVLIAWKIVLSAAKGLVKTFRLNEQSLMVIATLGAFGIRDYAEALAVMIFYIIGESFEEYARGKAHGEISSLVKLKPQSARVVLDDGTVEVVKPRKVKPGQVIRVLAGEVVALDGVLLADSAAIDTAAITGESEPRLYRKGEEVPSGCVNAGQVIELRAARDYRNSSITRLLNLIEDAAANKSRPEALIRRFSVWYTPIVVAAAAVMALVPLFISGASWSDWGTRALVFLVVSCPCALVLSVPLSFFGGMGAISKTGVMIKGSIYLENLARLKALAFDKTGTITRGRFTVTAVRPEQGVTENELLGMAAALEQESSHPLAKAVVEAAKSRGIAIPEVSEVTEKAGLGISGMALGKAVSAGRREFISEECGTEIPRRKSSGTDIYVCRGGKLAGAISLFDTPKESAAPAVRELESLGVATCLITGDKREAADEVARTLGMSEVLAEQLPRDKLRNFEAFKRAHGTAGFVGDGINDAPVLASSDVGIAMGQFGSQAAVEAADVVVMNDDLSKIPQAIRLSRRTYALALENMWLSIAIKLGILILGALGLANIWLAIFGDVGVLILAVLNAMRSLRFVKGKAWSQGAAQGQEA
ncbi:MAG: heavy metal translocating P-type ATPase [Aeromonadales bacterium]|nr:heavy metal translocating P-type ATPase [Aeromonadales bacterium]MDY2890575.1 heavy metal translocating P-type ATPase [Succinivibrio sp.]